MGELLVISGKSGVGKDTVIEYLTKDGWKRHPSLTTRPKRQGEIEGINYHFVGEQDFLNLKKAGELLDDINISGYWYGFPLNGLTTELATSDIVVNMVVESGLLLKRIIEKTLLVYLAFPDKETQIERLKTRGMTDYEIGIRLRDDPNKDLMPSYYDIEIVNYNSKETASKVNELAKGLNNEQGNDSFFKRQKFTREKWLPQSPSL